MTLLRQREPPHLKLKTSFIILRSMRQKLRSARQPCGRIGRAMTRCECADVAFDDLVREIVRGRSLDEVQVETGAGLLCTACLPDLREHLCHALAVRGAEAPAAETRAEPKPQPSGDPVDSAA